MRATELAERAVRVASGDEADAVATVERSGLARFAASRVHQPTLIADENVSIRVVRDGRVGIATTNRTDDEGLKATARRAAEAADATPPDPGFPGLPSADAVPDVTGYDEETATLSPEEQAERAWEAIAAVRDLGLYGFFTSGLTETAVASTTGVAAAAASTDSTMLVLAADRGRSGFADATSWRVRALNPAAVAERAAETARRTAGAGEIEPGTVRAVLAPNAFSELLWVFGFSSLSGLALNEDRSYLSGRLGEHLFHESFSLADDGLDPRGYPRAFDFEGVPRRRVPIVEGGTARDVVWDRRTAHEAGAGRRSTGHASSPAMQFLGPLPTCLAVAPGDATVDGLCASVGDGIFVTRLHYLGVVDPREGILTGMTRDGTFLVEGGKVTRPLVNLRFTTSFPELLRDLLGITRDVTLVSRSDFYGERLAFGTLVPAVATASFRITGTGSGPGL